MLVSSVPLSETHMAGAAANCDEGLKLAYDPQPGQRTVVAR
jgi:hypothetical protein